MVWIVLAIISTFLAIFYGKRGEDEEAYLAFILGVVFWGVSAGMIISGAEAYPELRSLRQKAITLQEGISHIREARYSVEPGSLVGGSLDNMGQSRALSQYLTEYAKVKAEANALLIEFQTKRRNTWYILFGPSAFYSSKIMELKPL